MRLHQLLTVILFGIVFSFAFPQGIVAEETTETEEAKEIKKKEIEDSRLRGIPVTTGIFISELVDYKYVPRQGKIQNGARSEFSLSQGNVFHYPLWRVFTFHNVSTYLTAGVALGLRGSDISKDLQAGVTANIFVNSKSFALVPSVGYMVAPVERLNCYSVGDDYPEDPAGITAPVYRHGWFVSFTFSTSIKNLLKDVLADTTTSDTAESEEVETENGQEPEVVEVETENGQELEGEQEETDESTNDNEKTEER